MHGPTFKTILNILRDEFLSGINCNYFFSTLGRVNVCYKGLVEIVKIKK